LASFWSLSKSRICICIQIRDLNLDLEPKLTSRRIQIRKEILFWIRNTARKSAQTFSKEFDNNEFNEFNEFNLFSEFNELNEYDSFFIKLNY
jgi:hypothetical protein